jgi:ribosomal protein S18 acetylase RimI-like enzyme
MPAADASSDLLWLADRNMLEFSKVGALWDRAGEIAVVDDLQLVASHTRFPGGVFNCAQALAGPADGRQARGWMQRALAFFGERGRGFSVYTRSDRDTALADVCAELAMQPMGSSPGMVLEREVDAARLGSEVCITRAHDAAGLADFASVVAPAYEMLSLPAAVSRSLFTDTRRVLSPDVAFFVAYLDGAPAATVISLASHGIAGLYWVGTRPDLQRRGLADAITRHACNAAFDAGAGCVILQATRFGEPVYRRIGFREITRYPWFFLTHTQVIERRAAGA